MSAARGLGSRILLPVFALVGVLTALLLLFAHRVTTQVREDYHRFTLTASTGRIATTLELAAAELTAAQLLGNPVVVAAKKGAVREAIAGNWAESRHAGVIADAGGGLVFSTLDAEATRAVLVRGGSGHHEIAVAGRRLHGYSQRFPLWGWTVTTVTPHAAGDGAAGEIYLLLPLAALGAFVLAAGLFWVLWRNLRRPVAEMVAALEEEREMPLSGIAELDRIGAAVNGVFARLRERTAQLTAELAQRRHAEATVRAKEEHIRLLLDSTAEGIYGVDTAGICTFCNPACLKLTGHDREGALLGKSIHELIHHTRGDGTAYPEGECRILQAYRDGRGVHVDDEVFWRADGSSFPVEYWSYPMIENGAVAGAVVTFTDISERRRSEELVRNILETVDEGFMVIDRDHRVTLGNRALAALLGSPLGRIVGRPCHEIFHQRPEPCAEGDRSCLLQGVFASGTPAAGELLHRRADGSEVRAEIRSYPVRDGGGGIASAIVTLTDVTARSALEQQLRQAQKMEAVGRLAGGIAHDFNNMLMAIVGFGSLAHDLSGEGTKARHYMEQVLAAADKAGDLTRQILAFSRRQVMRTEPADVNGVILGLGKILTRLLGEDIEVSFRLAAGELTALVDRGQIEQVLMNLCTNARDAMPAGGRLTIGTRAVGFDGPAAIAHGLEQPGRYALITVTDTGTGMDEKTRLRIFEPFFTTKEQGKGTGLGLSIVYGVVKQHRGQISVYSEPGQGTSFKVYLPLSTETVPVPAPEPLPPPRGGTETLLLAEDDETVRALAASVLEDAGYRVIATRDGIEAVRKFTAHQDEIALCVLDIVMPQMSGKEALERIRAMRPGARAMFMSGYAADILGDQRREDPGLVYLTKPLLPRELLRAVRAALDA